MTPLFGNVLFLGDSHFSVDCACELEDGDGCVGECYDNCDCYCEQYTTDD